jgi:chemotaxis signal transduction protein
VKNVIVLAVNRERYAVELRWVREVFTIDHITPVPHAPSTVFGVTNFRGAIVTVLNLPVLLGDCGPVSGHGAVVIETEDLRAALRVDNVAEVATLRETEGGDLIDGQGRRVQLLSPPELLAAGLTSVQSVVESRKGKP